MLLKMLVSPVIWLFMASSVLHAGSSVCERAVDMFYKAAEVNPVGKEEETETKKEDEA